MKNYILKQIHFFTKKGENFGKNYKMINISIDENALNAFKAQSDAVKKLIRKQSLAKLADDVFANAMARADEHTKSGVMRQAMYIRKISDLHWQVGIDDVLAPYGKWVHDGSRPHIIQPKRKKWLRWASNGSFVFAKKVNHPGYKGDAFFDKAIDEEVPKFTRWLENEINSMS